jgi:hypothetical protein
MFGMTGFASPPRGLDLHALHIICDWRLCLHEYVVEAYGGYVDSAF